MPATIAKLTSEQLEARVGALAAQLRQRRKVMGVNVTTAAEAAGVSRVTWHRMEKGEITVTIGVWFNALAALGLEFGIGLTDTLAQSKAELDNPATIPISIILADYPQLAALAWQIRGVTALSPREAFDIYERNQRHIDRESLTPEEESLMTGLEKVFGGAEGV